MRSVEASEGEWRRKGNASSSGPPVELFLLFILELKALELTPASPTCDENAGMKPCERFTGAAGAERIEGVEPESGRPRASKSAEIEV